METCFADAGSSFHLIVSIGVIASRWCPGSSTFYKCFVPDLTLRACRLHAFSCGFIEDWSKRDARTSVIIFEVNLVGIAHIYAGFVSKIVDLPLGTTS